MNKTLLFGLVLIAGIAAALYIMNDRKHDEHAKQPAKQTEKRVKKEIKPSRLKPQPELDPNPDPDSYEGHIRAELESINDHIQKDLATRKVQGL